MTPTELARFGSSDDRQNERRHAAMIVAWRRFCCVPPRPVARTPPA
jgi:hypothetical protein